MQEHPTNLSDPLFFYLKEAIKRWGCHTEKILIFNLEKNTELETLELFKKIK